ncbi:MAG: GNAT family N-acetyltransferase [Erythrobacter sp.]|nr:GNAT family N-acetyltransferase [Erythrobacter sp.]
MIVTLRPVSGERELFDPAVTGQFAGQMAEVAATEQVPPWCGYVGWVDGVPLGFGGFASLPDAQGVAEIGYLTFPAYEGCGVATAVAAELVRIAREGGLTAVIAHTLPMENASVAVLRRNGFHRDGEAVDPDEGPVWRWRLSLSTV